MAHNSFESITDHSVENVGFRSGREISKSGTRELPWDIESITVYSAVEAESHEAAEKLAEASPYISSIRVYEVREAM